VVGSQSPESFEDASSVKSPGYNRPLSGWVFADASVWKIGTPDLVVLSPEIQLKALAPDGTDLDGSWCSAI
jgi:hypothetical protein